jgi:hypothetical protein
MGRPRNWIAADVARVADGVLAEHWDVLQDEATRAELKSGLPNVRHSVPRANADCISEQTRCSASHISKACHPAYKVFFAGASGEYMAFMKALVTGLGLSIRGRGVPIPCSAGRAANCEDHK